MTTEENPPKKRRRRKDSVTMSDGERQIVFDPDTRHALIEAADFGATRALESIEKKMGIPWELHLEQHQDWKDIKEELIPYLRALKDAAEARKQMWEKWGSDKFKAVLDIVFWGVILSMLFGAYQTMNWAWYHFIGK